MRIRGPSINRERSTSNLTELGLTILPYLEVNAEQSRTARELAARALVGNLAPVPSELTSVKLPVI